MDQHFLSNQGCSGDEPKTSVATATPTQNEIGQVNRSSTAIKAIMCASGSRHLCAVEQFLYTQEYTATLSLRSSTAW